MRDERGVALPSLVATASLAAVVVAGAAFVVTSGNTEQPAAARPVTAEPTPTMTQAPQKTVQPKAEKSTKAKQSKDKKDKQPKKKDVDRRSDVYVEVYNNSGIAGLAGSTATTIGGAGWQVVGSDNWYGTIPATTVYYPDRYRDEARLLGKDLGIERLKPAISPMRFDRLTVILTADYS